jgi:hypothetical protein
MITLTEYDFQDAFTKNCISAASNMHRRGILQG